MLEFLKISVIAYAGFEVVPCENDIVPPPIATWEHVISSINRFRLIDINPRANEVVGGEKINKKSTKDEECG